MSLLRKLLFISAILAAYIAVFVSATDPGAGNNVCDNSKKPKASGSQNPDGECVTTVMGEVPGKSQMVSTVIRFPKETDVIQENTQFTVRTKTNNLVTGFFDTPDTQYFSFPQTLDDNGVIQGHSHVTIQTINNDDEPLDPTVFAFFDGLNGKADPTTGELTVSVDKGLPAGKYRICTMASSYAHQPVIMPVAKRGAQDDCRRFTVQAKSASPPPPKTAKTTNEETNPKTKPKTVETPKTKPKAIETKPKTVHKIRRSKLFHYL